MKHLALFEAFESDRLNKTLKYVNREAKFNLLQSLKSVCTTLDVPYSKLSDDFIDYLSYNSAIKKYKEGSGAIKLIKYWFNSEGKFILATGVDGRIKDYSILDAYEKGDDISIEDLLKMDNGTPVWTKVRYTSGKLNGEGFALLYKGQRNGV